MQPQGTSDPESEWIGIKPLDPSSQNQGNAASRQCYCYKFHIAESQSPGDFMYHTHRHGTTSALTWSGMFGLSLTGETSADKAREDLAQEGAETKSLTHDMVRIADDLQLEFEETDSHYFVIYDSVWAIKNNTDDVILSDFVSAVRGQAINPFFVNNEYQPTIQARTGALTVFRIACVSASRICAFMVIEGSGWDPNANMGAGACAADSKIIPFDILASDGISYANPVHRRGDVGDARFPDSSSAEAYLSMGGGMREVVAVQFPKAGTYTIWQRTIAFDDGFPQLLATVEVTGDDAEYKPISGYNLTSVRPHIDLPEEREVTEYRAMSFGTKYDQAKIPFAYYGVGDVNGTQTEAYKVDTYDIGSIGGTCAIWVIRSMDTMVHPFHIHVNPFMVIKAVSKWETNTELTKFWWDYTKPWDTETGVGLKGVWRDTAIVPPYGYLIIKQCYDAGVRPSPDALIETFPGKFVFHCHFLIHEDTGLMRNVIFESRQIGGNNDQSGGGNNLSGGNTQSGGNNNQSGGNNDGGNNDGGNNQSGGNNDQTAGDDVPLLDGATSWALASSCALLAVMAMA